MTNIKTIISAIVLTVSVSACASGPSTREMSAADFVKVTPGTHSPVQFEAIRNRCAQAGSNQGTSSLMSNFDFSLGATGMASLQQSLGNFATVMQSQQAETSTFQDCMANHGYYPS